MSQYLLLKKLNVQNANAIAGLTYGFPAITNFLGFAHGLSRKLPPELNINLGGVAVVSHKNTVHARQPKGWGDYVFALSRNPLTSQGKTAPINEEGRMSMQVSLLIELTGLIAGDEQTKQTLLMHLDALVPTMRLAGGQIISLESMDLLNSDHEQKSALRKLMPSFALIDRNDYLAEHFSALKKENPDVGLFDAWCDFSKIKYKATRVGSDKNTEEQEEGNPEKATWHYVGKPKPGYLVPISTGYYAISDVYEPGEVNNVRDVNCPVVFAETAYSVGEWQSTHRLQSINSAVWRYEYQHPWYLAKTERFEPEIPEPDANVIIDPDLY
ncbi:MAG: type I-F CRISPR-associated protein Csy2 [Arenicella sp.]|nr:type I-F CRISPR-associated protein Csy2 [Arenicella sp.]